MTYSSIEKQISNLLIGRKFKYYNVFFKDKDGTKQLQFSTFLNFFEIRDDHELIEEKTSALIDIKVGRQKKNKGSWEMKFENTDRITIDGHEIFNMIEA